jgi:hypothetical protein
LGLIFANNYSVSQIFWSLKVQQIVLTSRLQI